MTPSVALAVAAALAGQPAAPPPEAAPPPSPAAPETAPPATAPAPADPGPAPAPAPAPATSQPATTPSPAPTPGTPPPTAAASADDDDDDDDDDDEPTPPRRGTGNALLISAGVAGALGLIFNGLRVYTVTIPCQTDTQDSCSAPWVTESIFAWAVNGASIALAAAGGHIRGKHDANYDREHHRKRKRGAITAGIVLMSTGAVANMILRSSWLYDYVSPQGPEIFDFAYIGHSAAYYGGLQLSSWMFASGVGALLYGVASPDRRRVSISPSPFGVQVEGRF